MLMHGHFLLYFKCFWFRHEEWTHGLDKKKQPLFIIQDGQNAGKETFIECEWYIINLRLI